MSKFTPILGLCMMTALVLGPSALAQGTTTVAGYVVDSANSSCVIPNVSISFDGAGFGTAVTDGNGFFSLSLAAGSYNYTATSSNYDVVSGSITLVENQTNKMSISMDIAFGASGDPCNFN